MDTDAFRKAYTDYRKVEASVLSAQSSQWLKYAERSANAIDIATVKRPIFHIPYAGFAPVDSMETKKLYPARVSNLMPLSSTFTVNPTAGTERLFLDQWHQGLGLPNMQDDKAIENFKLMQKREYVDNYRSIMEGTRSSTYEEDSGKQILALARNFLAAVPNSNSKGPLLRTSKEVYDKLVLASSKLSPQSLTAIFDTIERITNRKDSGALDLRIQRAQASAPKDSRPADQIQRENLVRTTGIPADQIQRENEVNRLVPGILAGKGGADAATSTPSTANTTPPTIPNQGQKVTVDGTTPGPNDRPTTAPPSSSKQGTVNPYMGAPSTSPTDPAAAPPTLQAPPVPLVPISNEPTLAKVGFVDKDDSKPATLNDYLTMKSNFTKSRDLIENAYTASNQGTNIQQASATYSITDAALPRGTTPTGSQQAFVEKLRTDEQKAQAQIAMDMQIQKYMADGMTMDQAKDKVLKETQATKESKPTVDKAAAAILSNTENQARQVNANNTVISANSTQPTLPVTSIPTSTSNPVQQVPTQQTETSKPALEIKDPEEIAANPPKIPGLNETGDTTSAPAPAPAPASTPDDLGENDLGNIQVDEEPPPPSSLDVYKSFQETIDKIVPIWDPTLTAEEFARRVYSALGGFDLFKTAWNENKPPPGVNKNSFMYVAPRNMYTVFARFAKQLDGKSFLDYLLNAPRALNKDLFTFTNAGLPSDATKFITAKTDAEIKFRDAGTPLLGVGKPKRARSTSASPSKRSKVSYAKGYKSKKQRKLDRKAK
jgi:hypothetical protein